MWLNGQRFDINRQRVSIAVDVIRFVGRDVDVLPAEPQHVARSHRRPIRKEEPDADLDRLGLCARHEVQLHNQVGVRLKVPAHAVRRFARRLTWGPPEEQTVRESRFTAPSTFVTCTGLVFIAPPRQPRGIDLDVGVVNDAVVAGTKFHRPHVRSRLHGNRDDKRPEHVSRLRRQHVRLRHRDHEIGRSELPSIDPLWNGREVRRIAPHHPVRDPLLENGNLCLAQSPIALELAVTFCRLPWRHCACARDLRNLFGARPDIFICEQAERCHPPRPMTGGTVSKDKRRDMFREGHPLLRRGRGCAQNGGDRDNGEANSEIHRNGSRMSTIPSLVANKPWYNR